MDARAALQASEHESWLACQQDQVRSGRCMLRMMFSITPASIAPSSDRKRCALAQLHHQSRDLSVIAARSQAREQASLRARIKQCTVAALATPMLACKLWRFTVQSRLRAHESLLATSCATCIAVTSCDSTLSAQPSGWTRCCCCNDKSRQEPARIEDLGACRARNGDYG
eukprot:3850289-Pleurochrysis_carterae.AAC.1